MSHKTFVSVFSATIAAISCLSAIAAPLTYEVVIGIHTSPPTLGQREPYKVLVGPTPTGVFAGHENEIATRANGAWQFAIAEVGSEVLDLALGSKYFYAGTVAAARRVWPGSKWSPLAPAEPKWRSGGSIGSDRTLSEADHYKWFEVAPNPSATIFLPNPFSPTSSVQGMTLIFEQPDAIPVGAEITITGGGHIRLPDGSEVTKWQLPVGTGVVDTHVFRLVAGTTASDVAWYIVPGP